MNYDVKLTSYNGVNVLINGKPLSSESVEVIQRALQRHFIQLSAAIRGVPKHIDPTDDHGIAQRKINTILERRIAMDLIETFDGIRTDTGYAGTVRYGVEVDGILLQPEMTVRLVSLLQWYRDNWATDEYKERVSADDIIKRMQQE